MKLYTIGDETTLLTEEEFRKRTTAEPTANINKLAMTRNTLSRIEQCYLNDGKCIVRSDGIWGNIYTFIAMCDQAPKANATNWPYQISRYPDRIDISADTEENAKRFLHKIFDQYYTKIDEEIFKWQAYTPRYQQFDFDESKIQIAEPAPFSSLEELEEAVKNR